ncbi:UPF0183 protein, partial [Mucuna pruriens]
MHYLGSHTQEFFYKERGIYTLFYLDLSFAFLIPTQFTNYYHDWGIELTLEFPNWTTLVGVRSLMDNASSPSLPIDNIYTEGVQVKLEEEFYFTINTFLLVHLHR